ncbi:MAG: serine hydrolase [candidate division Zixibacteria bacterium]|nr:serine hydrolase [candidate division Zixibacteria bacterium]
MKTIFTGLLLVIIIISQPFKAEELQSDDLSLKQSGSILNNTEILIDSAEVDTYINNILSTYHLPGVAAAIVRKDRLTWIGSYGMANISEGTAVGDTTLFLLGSTSKPVYTAALMQLWEDGLFGLDDNISDHLSFDLVNPNFPDSIITPRFLMTHLSSIRDTWSILNTLVCEGDYPQPLVEFLPEYLLPGSMFYITSNFLTVPPGSNFSYTDVGGSVAAHLVEALSGLTLEQYCQDSVFLPLNMTETSWFLAGLDTDHIAMPYSYSGGMYNPAGHYGVPAYPGAQLRTSALQLANFLMMVMNNGLFDSTRILDSATVALINTVQFPEKPQLYDWKWGLNWYHRTLGDRMIRGHSGGGVGISTFMFFCPLDESGVIVLSNGESFSGVDLIAEKLFDFAVDTDADGISYFEDNCPENYNPEQHDSDSDNIGDLCDLCPSDPDNDIDGDGFCGDVDNCPEIYNPGQEDINNDNIGDACCCTGVRGNTNCSESDEPDISDISRLIDYLYLSHGMLCCPNEADADASGGEPDISDITRLIDYLYLSHGPLSVCP